MALFNFKLFVRPTVVGKAIIDRLSAEGVDRQAEARRWLELGYALEQVGFRLDGTTLYHGGRPFSGEHVLSVQPASPAILGGSIAPQAPLPSLGATVPAEPIQASIAPDQGGPHAAAPAAPSSEPPRPLPSPTSIASPVSDEMTDNLRNLSM